MFCFNVGSRFHAKALSNNSMQKVAHSLHDSRHDYIIREADAKAWEFMG